MWTSLALTSSVKAMVNDARQLREDHSGLLFTLITK